AIKVEGWVRQQPEAKIVTTYIGQGAPRFFFSYNPELPDPAFAKLVILTPDARARDRLKLRLRKRIAQGLAPEARVRVSQLIFGPYPRYLVNFRVMGPDPDELRDRKSTRLNSSHVAISYAVFCLKKKINKNRD